LTVVKGGRREWELGGPLDSGGFGEVFHARSGDQEAVIKLVPKDAGAERELLVADDLSGVRNVIPLLDRGETPDRWALVMPRAERSLRQYLAQQSGPPSLEETMSIMADVAEALVDLGAKEIVHRDLKPENVLLLHGSWCLADFGISRYAEAATAADTRKFFFMSRAYAAPEQWRQERATSAADVYALGVIGFELVTGSPPFPGPDYRDQHLHDSPPALTVVPAPAAALLQQCLLKAPGSRPTPADLLSGLRRQASAAPVSGGLAALQEANRAEVSRLSEEARRASEAQTEAERRDALLRDAGRQLGSIGTTLREAIRSAASAVTDVARVAGWGSGERTHGWQLRLGGGALDLVLRH
jgi:serine/threonine protein kinase